MYEDFNYITDNNFLINYWRQEKVICQKCQGEGNTTIANLEVEGQVRDIGGIHGKK